jgi:hypothetical protein
LVRLRSAPQQIGRTDSVTFAATFTVTFHEQAIGAPAGALPTWQQGDSPGPRGSVNFINFPSAQIQQRPAAGL